MDGTAMHPDAYPIAQQLLRTRHASAVVALPDEQLAVDYASLDVSFCRAAAARRAARERAARAGPPASCWLCGRWHVHTFLFPPGLSGELQEDEEVLVLRERAHHQQLVAQRHRD